MFKLHAVPLLCFLIIRATSVVQITALSPDGQALLSLIPSNPQSSKSQSSVLSTWNPSSPNPCSWQGITCSAQNRVISLSIPNTFLNLSSLPTTLSSLTSLQLLNLSTTNVAGQIPLSFGLLTNLTLLDLSSNSLSGPIPDTLGSLTSLNFLFLNSNKLSGQIPDTLSNMTSLQILCLQDNVLNGTIPSKFGSLTSLRELRIGETLT